MTEDRIFLTMAKISNDSIESRNNLDRSLKQPVCSKDEKVDSPILPG
jgi:hypothetical protein